MCNAWTKIRCQLENDNHVFHIKVALLSRAEFRAWLGGSIPMAAIPYIVCDGLRRIWCWAADVSDKGFIEGAALDILDQVSGVPGIGVAMAEAGWAADVDNGILLPNFEEHNWPQKKRAKTGAERAKAYRERKKEREKGTPPSNVTPSQNGDSSLHERTATGHMCTSPHPTEELPPAAPTGAGGKKKDQKKKAGVEHDELFEALAMTCNADPDTSESHIERVAKLLRKANPSYTADDVIQLPFVMAKTYKWFKVQTLGQVEKYIGILRPRPKVNPYKDRDLWDQASQQAQERARQRESEAREAMPAEQRSGEIQQLLAKLKGARDQCPENASSPS